MAEPSSSLWYWYQKWFNLAVALLIAVYSYLNDWSNVCYGALAFALFTFNNNRPRRRLKDGDKFRVVVVGSGFSGILAGIRLQELGVDFVILEKSTDLGGTWHDNRYPGAGCDVPSYFYCYSFFPNPW